MEQKPSIGRIVIFQSGEEGEPGRPLPAIVQRVWSDTCLNLTVFTDEGPVQKTSVFPLADNQGKWGWSWPPRT